MNYAHTVTVPLSHEHAVARMRELLDEQGFGILTEIDVRATFAKELGPDSADAIGEYVILGACNPALAQKALTAEPDMGLLLPCNVVIRRAPGAEMTVVQTINPQTMVELSPSSAMEAVAADADARLLAALKALESPGQR